MRPIAFVIIFLFVAISSFAQQLLVVPENDAAELVWNEKFIARNSIAEITGKLSAKRDGEPIIPQRERYLYKFDLFGRTIYSNTSFGRPGTGSDTASVHFEYDSSGRIIRKMRTDLNGHFEYNMERDSLHRVIRNTYSRIQNLNTDRYLLKPGEITEIYDERFSYQRSGSDLLKRIHLNDQGLPYREDLFRYNENGYLIEVENVYLISRKRTSEQFAYDNRGRLTQRILHSNRNKKPTRNVFTYDSVGNLVKREVWSGEIKTTKEEFLYNTDTALLSARLTQDVQTGVIRIVKFKHAYR